MRLVLKHMLYIILLGVYIGIFLYLPIKPRNWGQFPFFTHPELFTSCWEDIGVSSFVRSCNTATMYEISSVPCYYNLVSIWGIYLFFFFLFCIFSGLISYYNDNVLLLYVKTYPLSSISLYCFCINWVSADQNVSSKRASRPIH